MSKKQKQFDGDINVKKRMKEDLTNSLMGFIRGFIQQPS
jgi:hypothetical protein